jgi:hypothetical protein
MISCTPSRHNDRLCPFCAQIGALRDLTVGHGVVLLSLQCRRCAHAWTARLGLRVPDWQAQAAEIVRQV